MRGLFFFWLISSIIITLLFIFLIVRIEGVTFKDMVYNHRFECLAAVFIIFVGFAAFLSFLCILFYPLLKTII